MQGIIVGGGIAGLSTAIALREVGIYTQVYEAAPEIKPIGAGIVMAVNAMQILDKWGLANDVAKAGVTLNKMGIYNRKLKPLSVLDLAWAKEKYGFSNIAIHRGKLQQVLLSKLPPGTVTPDRRFSYFSEVDEENGLVSTFFQNKDVATGRFVIGADGYNSALRKQLYPPAKLRYSGQTCWRGVVNMELPEKYDGIAVEAWARKKRFGFLSIGGGQVYWYGVMTADERGFNEKARLKETLLHIFGKFAQPVPDLIEQTPLDDIIRNDLYDLPLLNRWYKGLCCLVGDAAHASTPNMGQGGAQAIEDAWSLSQEFARGGEFEEIFKRFQSKRSNKTAFIIKNSYSIGRMAHMPIGIIPRNLIMMLTPSYMARGPVDKVFDIENWR